MDDETIIDKIKDWWWNYIERPVKFFWQRRTRGFDDPELWSLDNTLAEYILPRLKAFREGGLLGIPASFCNNVHIHLDDEAHDEELEKWKAVIDKMIFAFEYAANDYWDGELYDKDMGKYRPAKWSFEWLDRK